MVDLFQSQVDYTRYSQIKSMVLTLYNSGLKLIKCLIYYRSKANAINSIRVNCCNWLSNYIKTFINQHIQTPLVLKSFKIKVRDN